MPAHLERSQLEKDILWETVVLAFLVYICSSTFRCHMGIFLLHTKLGKGEGKNISHSLTYENVVVIVKIEHFSPNIWKWIFIFHLLYTDLEASHHSCVTLAFLCSCKEEDVEIFALLISRLWNIYLKQMWRRVRIYAWLGSLGSGSPCLSNAIGFQSK